MYTGEEPRNKKAVRQMGGDEKTKPHGKADIRRERLAAALRANLRKRKAQARARVLATSPAAGRGPDRDKRSRG